MLNVVAKGKKKRAKTIKWLIINAKWWQFAHEIGSFTSGYDVLPFTCVALALDMSAHYIHMNASSSAAFGSALSIQLKRFLFLFHIYVKIHFVFYSNAWVSLRIYIFEMLMFYTSIYRSIRKSTNLYQTHIPTHKKLGSHSNGLKEKTYMYCMLYICVIERARKTIHHTAETKHEKEKKWK